jgi:hypothetical protein
MNNKMIEEKMLQVLQSECTPETLEKMLESRLIDQVLNPAEFKIQRKRIVDKPSALGISSETREGTRLNEYGILEKIIEEILYVQILDDGTTINEHGISKCQSCGQIVSAESIRRCPCGKTVCISKACGVYSKRKDEWFCSRKHATLAMLGINLRWIR